LSVSNYVRVADKYGGWCAVAVKSRLSVSHFTVVVEDDGSSVCDEVLTAIIEDGESLGTLMILNNSQNWTRGLCYS